MKEEYVWNKMEFRGVYHADGILVGLHCHVRGRSQSGFDGRGRTEMEEENRLSSLMSFYSTFSAFCCYDFDRNRPASSPVPCSSLSGLCKQFSDSLQVVRDRFDYPRCRFPYRRSFLSGNASKFPSRSSHNVAGSSPSVSGFHSFMSRFVETQIVGNTIHSPSIARKIFT